MVARWLVLVSLFVPLLLVAGCEDQILPRKTRRP